MAMLDGSIMLADVTDPNAPALFSAGNTQKVYDMLPRQG